MNNNSYINIAHSRSDNQKGVMKQISKDNVCPFCPKNLSGYHKNPILKTGKFWLATKNQWPYDGAELHLLFVCKTHVVQTSELKPKALLELFELIAWTRKKFKVKGGAIVIREGETDITGATVDHLHAHFVHGAKKPRKNPKYPDDFITTVIGYKTKIKSLA